MASSEIRFLLDRERFTQPFDARDMQGCMIGVCPENARWICTLVVTTREPAEPSKTARHKIHLCHEHADAAIQGSLSIPAVMTAAEYGAKKLG